MLKALPASKWNYASAAHLYNRAGFGGTPKEIENLSRMGPEKAVSFFVDFENIPDPYKTPEWAKPDPERYERVRQLQQMARQESNTAETDDQKKAEADKRRELQRENQRDEVQNLQQMRGQWLERMALGARPFQEKLTLFWHGHFATSAVKVRDAFYMWRQIETFRKKGSGNWLDLLNAAATEPAMLIWLDQAQSREQHPNENFARECMELFTLGEGHYTEKDVTEAARAMTGWSLDREKEEYHFRPFAHDYGEKTILGQTGNFYGKDVLRIIVEQPQAARFITGKLWKFFAGTDCDPAFNDTLAEIFRASNNDFKPLLRQMFRSEDFYADAVVGAEVKSPIQWLVGTVRLLERPMPPPIVSTTMTKTLGQDLLVPPNVKGWDGGLSWITTNTLLARYNDAAVLIMGQGDLKAQGDGRGFGNAAARFANQAARRMYPADVEKITTPEDRQNAETLTASLGRRFLNGQLTDKHRQILRDFLGDGTDFDEASIRHAIRLLMCTPEYQVT